MKSMIDRSSYYKQITKLSECRHIKKEKLY